MLSTILVTHVGDSTLLPEFSANPTPWVEALAQQLWQTNRDAGERLLLGGPVLGPAGHTAVTPVPLLAAWGGHLGCQGHSFPGVGRTELP